MTSWKALACGVLGCALVVGCGQPAAPSKAAPEKKDDGDDHEHGEGPHGGTVIELGKYHGEFTVDHGTKTATVYILDGKRGKKAEPVAATKLRVSIKSPQFDVEAAAVPEKDDPAGKASRFVAKHDNFGKEQEFEGSVTVEVDGKPYTGDFKEKAHDHDHDHGKKK
ncbi:hypothetical protein J0H58_22220 [bacterium]|nr:hypothetical protein [bacterium]